MQSSSRGETIAGSRCLPWKEFRDRRLRLSFPRGRWEWNTKTNKEAYVIKDEDNMKLLACSKRPYLMLRMMYNTMISYQSEGVGGLNELLHDLGDGVA